MATLGKIKETIEFITDENDEDGRALIFKRSDTKSDSYYYEIKFPKLPVLARSCRTSNRSEARKAANKAFYEMLGRLNQGISITTPNLKQFTRKWLLEEEDRIAQEGLHENSILDKKWHVRTICEYFGDMEIARITKEDVRGFIKFLFNYQRERGIYNKKDGRYYKLCRQRTPNGRLKTFKQVLKPYKATTVRHIIWTFDRVMKRAVELDYIQEGKRPHITVKAEDFARKSISHHDQKRMLNAVNISKFIKYSKNGRKITKRTQYAREAFACYMYILKYTGLRITEARWLNWGHYLHQVKNDKPYVSFQLTHSKVKKVGRRKIMADPNIHQHVQRLYKLQTKYLGREPHAIDPMFVNADGKRVKDYCWVWNAYMEFLGLTEDGKRPYTLYCWRHTFATTRLTKNADPYQLAKHMGTSFEMLSKHYDHSVPEEMGHLVHGVTEEKLEARIKKQKEAENPIAAMMESNTVSIDEIRQAI